ncbi:hypothetical protein MNVM_15390 [Mycobacterium novum]|uniref:Uncharacterized protein n=1 Tax=Mycobacterium novum TaxID=2492438 RepID=A0A7I7JM23_9MYCO|nr:hypothetical protein MNVM_15390 [Mycobacterium novum]
MRLRGGDLDLRQFTQPCQIELVQHSTVLPDDQVVPGVGIGGAPPDSGADDEDRQTHSEQVPGR